MTGTSHLTPRGALLAGNSVDIHSTDEFTNSGSILGRKLVQIKANTINNNAGQIGGNDAVLTALQDINPSTRSLSNHIICWRHRHSPSSQFPISCTHVLIQPCGRPAVAGVGWVRVG